MNRLWHRGLGLHGVLIGGVLGLSAVVRAEPAPNVAPASTSTSASPIESEEILPVTVVDQALRLYRSVCLNGLADQAGFADLAINSGLQLVKSSQMARGDDPNATDLLVFTPGLDTGVELTIRSQTRCTVWLRSEGSKPLARGFQRAVNQLKKERIEVDWRLDRLVTQKDATRRQLRAELAAPPTRRARADAAFLPVDVKIPAIQAMALQLEPDLPVVPSEPRPDAPTATPADPSASAVDGLPPPRPLDLSILPAPAAGRASAPAAP